MVRDLLPQLQAASESARKKRGGKVPPVTSTNGKHTSIEMQTLKSDDKNMNLSSEELFRKRIENVIENIHRIENNNKKIRSLQGQVLSDTNLRQVEKNKAELDDLVESNKRFGIQVQNALRKEQDRLDDNSIAAAKANVETRTSKEDHEMRLRRTQIAAHSKYRCTHTEFITILRI